MTKMVDLNCRFSIFFTGYKISGILPNVTTEMMKYCCSSSKITFGHYFKSIRDIEDHFKEDSEIDVSFPIYGMCYCICFLQKNDRQLYLDIIVPFKSVVLETCFRLKEGSLK